MTAQSDMMSNQRRRAVLVLGMHRSGTSALAGVLSLLGVRAPKSMYPANEWNQRGYWESTRLNEFHERILQSANSEWRDWRPFDPAWIHSSFAQDAFHELRDLLTAEFGNANIFVVKDPRICRFTPFWLKALEQFHVQPDIVIPIRNPLDVAHSLYRRDQISTREALLIWLRHCLDAEAATRHLPRTFTHYNDLLMDWRQVVKRIAENHDLELRAYQDAVASEVEQFLTVDLRHSAVLPNAIEDRGDVFHWVKRSYRAFESLISSNGADSRALEILDLVKKEFDEAADVFGPPFLKSKLRVRELSLDVERLTEKCRTQSTDIEGLSSQSQHAEEKLRRVTDELCDLNAKHTSLENHLTTERFKRKATLNTMGRLFDDRQKLKSEVRQLVVRRQASDNQLSTLTERLQKATTALSQAEARTTTYQQTLSKSNADVAASRLVAQQLQEQNDALSKMLLTAQARPLKMLRQRLKHRSGSFILKFETLLPVSFATRMRKATQKAAPFYPEASDEQRQSHTGSRALAKHRKRKVRQSRFLLRFKAVMPGSLAVRLQRRLEKNSSSDALTRAGAAKLLAQPAARLSTHLSGPAADIGSDTAQSLSSFVTDILKRSTNEKSSEYVPFADHQALQTSIRAIAFYLPQFHPFPENDAWWGKGFTEWTNVSKAVPQFMGHDQPRLPGELGFYDLRLDHVQKRQIELARNYGLHGFCFHYYWFSGGKRLLELPLNQFVNNKNLDFPFCICWANENWTRRWDGMEHEILMEQCYRPEDDLEIIKDMLPLLKDPRYITINGRPIIIVYRVSLLPNPEKTAQIWRSYCRENDVAEPYLVAAQAFGITDPRPYGFDAAVEFPPHGVDIRERHDLKVINPDYDGRIIDYEHIARRSYDFVWPDYKLFKAVMPSWDNEARRPGRGHTYFGSTPAIYGDWLKQVCRQTCANNHDPDEKLVFINGWNEWAEGAYLEPDRRYGYAYLEATRHALASAPLRAFRRAEGPPLILVSHDAMPYGAQFLALNLARTLTEDFSRQIEIILLGAGQLKGEFEQCGCVHDLSGVDPNGVEVASLLKQLSMSGCKTAICNTSLSGHLAAAIKAEGFHVISLIHEMAGVITEHRAQAAVRHIAQHADHVAFASAKVAEDFEQIAGLAPPQRIILPQGLYKKNRLRTAQQISDARNHLRQRFGLSAQTNVILAVGHVSRRKGTDLFVEAGLRALKKQRDLAFIWLGHKDPGEELRIQSRLEQTGLQKHFIFPGLDLDTDIYYAGADMFAMCSREDPFPSVVLEAMDASLPVIAFAGATGCGDIIQKVGGLLVPAFEVEAYALAIRQFTENAALRRLVGSNGCALINNEFSFHRYAHDLLALANEAPKRVSVIVPNYNYAHFLADRIATIVNQTYPIYEIIVLDDASKDESVRVAEASLAATSIPSRLILNEQNSGSVFRQWLRGVEQASGDFVWIAEADDLSDPGFLTHVMAAFSEVDVVISYCQSKQMASDGTILSNDYLDYVSEVSPQRWRSRYVADGESEVRDALAVKNTIPNVSAAVFRRESLLRVLRDNIEEIASYKVAGDWLTYALLLEDGKLAFCPESLNNHRRHATSVTVASNQAGHLAEIVAVQSRLREKYPALTAHKQAADAYAQKLSRQFNLQSS